MPNRFEGSDTSDQHEAINEIALNRMLCARRLLPRNNVGAFGRPCIKKRSDVLSLLLSLHRSALASKFSATTV